MKVLVIDVGGNHVKMLATGQKEHRQFASGPTLTPEEMVTGILQATRDWEYEVITIGYPGVVREGRPKTEPVNLSPGWVDFDFQGALSRPVKIINDAAMQALGSYEGGRMLFLGLGTGLGSSMVIEGVLQPMELGHLPYKRKTFEEYVGARALDRLGKKKWRICVMDMTERLTAALEPDYVVLGGGNAQKLKELPPNCRLGNNANAFLGGFRIWEAVPHVVI